MPAPPGPSCLRPDQPFLLRKALGREFLAFVGQMYGLDEALCADRAEQFMTRLDITEFAQQLAEGLFPRHEAARRPGRRPMPIPRSLSSMSR